MKKKKKKMKKMKKMINKKIINLQRMGKINNIIYNF